MLLRMLVLWLLMVLKSIFVLTEVFLFLVDDVPYEINELR